MTHPAKGGLPEAQHVGDGAVEQADHHVHGRHGPGVGEVVEDGLVLQVEEHVEPVPAPSSGQLRFTRACSAAEGAHQASTKMSVTTPVAALGPVSLETALRGSVWPQRQLEHCASEPRWGLTSPGGPAVWPAQP